MRIIVQKYGGSSLSDITKLKIVANKIVTCKKKGFEIVVVVSAMGNTTNDLLKMARKISTSPQNRELDMLLSTGERITMSLLSLAIQDLGYKAISFTGSQCGIVTTDSHTDARIIEVRPFRVQDELLKNKIVIVAGFQGVSYKKEITTLGRGGSDTTAVALAAALDAEACEIYSDVDGVYSSDPKIIKNTVQLPEISYQEMQEMAESGAKVLNAQAVEFAKRSGIAIYARASDNKKTGETVVRKDIDFETYQIKGITFEENILLCSGIIKDKLNIFLNYMDSINATGKQLVYINDGNEKFSIVISSKELLDLENLKDDLNNKFKCLSFKTNLGAISVIGDGINDNHKILIRIIDKFNENNIPYLGIHTSSFRITFILESEKIEKTVKFLHNELIL